MAYVNELKTVWKNKSSIKLYWMTWLIQPEEKMMRMGKYSKILPFLRFKVIIMGLSEIFPSYPIQIISPRGGNVKIASRRVYVDFPYVFWNFKLCGLIFTGS